VHSNIPLTLFHNQPEPSPGSCHYRALRFCGWALRSCRGGLDIQIKKKFH